MRRLGTLVLLLASVAPAARAASVYVTPDVPATVGADTYLPSEVIRDDSGARSLELSLPSGAAVDALFRRDDGRWLLSFEVPVLLSGTTFQPSDVALYDGAGFSLFFDGAAMGVGPGVNLDAVFLVGGDGGDVVASFDVPTVVGGLTVPPGDLVRFSGGMVLRYLDSSATAPPIPLSSNVTGADERHGLTILTFDVPTTLGAATYLPGDLVSWDGASFALFQQDPLWPPGGRFDGVAFLADPGEAPMLQVAPSAITPGDLVLSWTSGCSAGAEDYAIYEGTIGSWYSHQRIDCADDGSDLTEEIAPAPGDRYYLVVPTNPNDEGSYGTDSLGVQRPPGTSTCLPTQVVSQCP